MVDTSLQAVLSLVPTKAIHCVIPPQSQNLETAWKTTNTFHDFRL